ncbi:MAG: TetR family transcriptional regulator C-terminal domain-containing protein [Flavobacteriales bacterium]|nr:TetR family transcriptional regulator C-terminal domain-containing protein [Flavobacteriales bacterium]
MELFEQYISYVSEHGIQPATVGAFCKAAGITEPEFYKQYASFSVLEDHIWKTWIEETIQKVSSSEAYANYSVREKYLAFCFGLTQQLLPVRSFVTWRFTACRTKDIYFFHRFRNAIKDHFHALIHQGLESGEIPSRFGIHRFYADAAFIHVLATIKFWVDDSSDEFEKTDEFIEKSVHFQMDLITRNGLDSGAELGKFFFQQVWK